MGRHIWLTGVAILALAGPSLALSGSARAQSETGIAGSPAAPISNLPDALAAAYRLEPNLLGERANNRGADERLVQARSLYGPTISLNGSYGYYYNRFDNDPADPFAPGPRSTVKGDSGTITAIISQPLFASGRIAAGVQAATARVAFQRETLRFTEQRTLLSVISSYVGVRRDNELLEIANGNIALLDRQLSESDSRFRVREITRTDLDQVVTRVEIGRATVQSASSNLATSKSQFVQFVGAPPGALESLPLLPNLPATIEEARAGAETRSPLVLAARARERASAALVRQARGQMGPSVSLQGDASYGGINEYTLQRKQRVLRGTVQLDMPLYTSGQLQAVVREAKANNDSDWRLIDASVRETTFNVDAAWNLLVATRNSLTNLENAVAAAQRAYDGAVVQLRAGARATLDVLDLARDLLNARSQLVSVRANEYLASANLLSAMGELEIRNLVPDLPPYDPEVHYRKVLHRGDTIVPGIIPTVLDGIVAGSGSANRASRDTGVSPAPTLAPLPPPPSQVGP